MKNVRKTSSFLSLQLNTLNSTTVLKNIIESEIKKSAKDYNQSKSIITYSSIDDVRNIITNEYPLFLSILMIVSSGKDIIQSFEIAYK